MGGSRRAGRQPNINPADLIRQQQTLNRIGTNTPFGSTSYGTDANGQQVLNTTLTPEMQELLAQAMSTARTRNTRYQAPSGFSDILNRLTQRNAQRITP